MTGTTTARIHHVWAMRVVALLMSVAVVLWGLASPGTASGQDATAFPELETVRRIYDTTGSSLTPEQVAALERQLTDLQATGADAVLFVRALDTSPDETLDQVEALQQAWVATTGRSQDTAVAILINRNPEDPNDARAGIFAGSTFDDGNVPRDEQEAIVEEALIPPLRDGDVYTSFAAGLDRLGRSIINGPPPEERNAFEEWSADAGGSWLPWAGTATAVAGLAGGFALFRTRRQSTLPARPATTTTTRPGDLTPALGAALAIGGPQVSALPATILDLASRDVLDIEPESEGGALSKPTIQVRLLDQGEVSDEVEVAVWTTLAEHAEDGVVSSKNLTGHARQTKAVNGAIERQMLANGWADPNAARPRAGLVAMAILGLLLALGIFVVAAVGDVWLPAIGVVALLGTAVVLFVMHSAYPRLTPVGQEAALPWIAYRRGLQGAIKDDPAALDLDAVLADAVAMNLGTTLDGRLKAATASGQVLRAFTSRTTTSTAGSTAAYFPFWVAYSSTVSTSGSGTTSTVSSGGSGSGGGAAGST